MRPLAWHRPRSLDEALRLLAEGAGELVPLAGGSDLLERLADGLADPAGLVSIGHLAELRAIREEGDEVVIGGGATLASVAASPLVRDRCAVLAEVCDEIGSVQIRNVATLAGNLLQGPRCPYYRSGWMPQSGEPHPGFAGETRYGALFDHDVQPWVHPSDGATVLAATGATVEVVSAQGGREGDPGCGGEGGAASRRVPVAELLPLPTEAHRLPAALAPGELIAAIRVPRLEAGVFLKVRERALFDFSLVSVCAVRRDGEVHMALGGVSPRPRLVAAATAILAQRWMPAEVADVALAGARPLPHNAYKVTMARNLTVRALNRLEVLT